MLKNLYRKYITAAVALVMSLPTIASVPSWVDPKTRNILFPPGEYYVGVWTVEFNGGSREVAEAEALRLARQELAKSIYSNLSITTSSLTEVEETDEATNESIKYQQSSIEQTSALLVNVASELYRPADRPMVTAFAYVKRRELHDYNVSAVETRISEIKGSLSDARRLFDGGEKRRSHELCLSLPPMLRTMDRHIEMINVIGIDRTEHASLQAELSQLNMEIDRMISETDQSVRFFIEGVGGRPVGIISGYLKKQLSENGCEVVDSAEVADYVLRLSAEMRESSVDNADVTYAFADIDATLTHVAKSKRLYEGQFSKKGGGLNYDKAARKALDSAGKEILKSILDKIK